MRRRSGAFHSESEEQFLLLAELSYQKPGYFYDEAVHKQVSQGMKSRKKVNSLEQKEETASFQGFDFNPVDREKQQELKELQAENKEVFIHIVLICDKQEDIAPVLNGLWPYNQHQDSESSSPRLIDLHILKIQSSKNKIRCFKFWIIEAGHISSPLCSSYLKRALKVLNFSSTIERGEPCERQKAKNVLFELVEELSN